MQLSDIENIDVTLIKQSTTNMLGAVKVKLTCGILLAGIRLYPDNGDPNKVFLSFPTRTDNEGNKIKLFFPYNNETRELLTESVQRIYDKKKGVE